MLSDVFDLQNLGIFCLATHWRFLATHKCVATPGCVTTPILRNTVLDVNRSVLDWLLSRYALSDCCFNVKKKFINEWIAGQRLRDFLTRK